MKIKDFRRINIQDNDLLIFSINEFDTDAKRERLCRSLSAMFYNKKVGIVFVKNVHDSIEIQKKILSQIDEKIKERKNIQNETPEIRF